MSRHRLRPGRHHAAAERTGRARPAVSSASTAIRNSSRTRALAPRPMLSSGWATPSTPTCRPADSISCICVLSPALPGIPGGCCKRPFAWHGPAVSLPSRSPTDRRCTVTRRIPPGTRLKAALLGAFKGVGADLELARRLYFLAHEAGLKDIAYRTSLLAVRSIDPMVDYLPSTVESLRTRSSSSGCSPKTNWGQA